MIQIIETMVPDHTAQIVLPAARIDGRYQWAVLGEQLDHLALLPHETVARVVGGNANAQLDGIVVHFTFARHEPIGIVGHPLQGDIVLDHPDQC